MPAAATGPPRRTWCPGGGFDAALHRPRVIVDCVGGATFGRAIEHVASRGIVVNIATRRPTDIISFRAARFDRSAGVRIFT
jgi:hypothetical protein